MNTFLNNKNKNKKLQTRLEIIDAAIKVIAKSGRDTASILEITKVAKKSLAPARQSEYAGILPFVQPHRISPFVQVRTSKS